MNRIRNKISDKLWDIQLKMNKMKDNIKIHLFDNIWSKIRVEGNEKIRNRIGYLIKRDGK